MYYVYMVRCADQTLYTGWTNDLARRLAAHNSGRGAKYTRSRRPVQLVYAEVCPDKSAALRREWQIKHLPAKRKRQLTESGKITGWEEVE